MDERRQYFYRAYLLRLWCEEPVSRHSPDRWRASLRTVGGDMGGDARIGFASLDELCRYLRQEPNRTKHPDTSD